MTTAVRRPHWRADPMMFDALQPEPTEREICLDVALKTVESRLPGVIDEYPLLNVHGYGEPDPAVRRRWPNFCAGCDRELLPEYIENIAFAVCWLCEPGRKIVRTFRSNTYGLKHYMEDETGRYIGNGEMIAAFLILGLPIRLDNYNPAVRVAA